MGLALEKITKKANTLGVGLFRYLFERSDTALSQRYYRNTVSLSHYLAYWGPIFLGAYLLKLLFDTRRLTGTTT